MTPELLDELRAHLTARRPVVVATRLTSSEQRLVGEGDPLAAAAHEALRTDRPQTVEDPAGDWFLRPYNPPLRLVIVGAVHIAQALVPMAEPAGYAVTVVDPRGAWATEQRFPGVARSTDWPDEYLEAHPADARTAVVVLTHDPKIDDPALEAALRSGAFYIGALGSTRTHEKRRARLKRHHGFTDVELDRIAGPLGLPIGARTPAEIAISTLAQITQVLRRAPEPAP